MNALELKAQMVRKGKSVNQICKSLNISNGTWFRKIRGDSQFTQGEIITLRKELSLDDRTTACIFFNEQVS